MANAIGVRVLAYQHYGHGQREPRLSTLAAPAGFYNITLDSLVCREVQKREKE